MSRICFFVIIILIINSCAIHQKSQNKIINDKTSLIEIIKNQNQSNKKPEWLFIKGKINIINQKSESDLNFTLKSKTDSIILLSVTALLGFEIFKFKVTPDSIFYINKVNKTIYSRSFPDLQNQINRNILFSDLINILTSNQKILKDKYDTKYEENNYYLESKKSKYVIDLKTKKILSSNIYFNNKEKNIFCEFLNYKKIKSHLFANIIKLKTEEFSVKLEYEKVILDVRQRMVFKIPDNYAKK